MVIRNFINFRNFKKLFESCYFDVSNNSPLKFYLVMSTQMQDTSTPTHSFLGLGIMWSILAIFVLGFMRVIHIFQVMGKNRKICFFVGLYVMPK